MFLISASSSRESVETSSPSRKYCPFVGLSRQPIMFMKVLFPEPDAPMMETNSPSAMSIDTPRSALTSISPR